MMLILRIKQAEVAFADGRLDEAYDLLQDKNIQQQKRGQILLGKLARQLAKRANQHLEEGRTSQAFADCNKAEKLAGNIPVISKLRQDLSKAMLHNQQALQNRSRKLNAAKQNLDNGWLSVGEKILEQNSRCDSRANLLLNHAAAMRLQIEAVVASAQQALKRDDLEAAIDIIKEAKLTNSKNNQAADLIARIKSMTEQKIVDYLNTGRIDLASCLLQHLKTITSQSAKIKELSSVIADFDKAASLIKKGQPQSVERILQKLKVIMPSAIWLDAAINQAQTAGLSLNQLQAGPLGLIENQMAESSYLSGGSPLSVKNNIKQNNISHHLVPQPESNSLPAEFLLQLDGIGSYLVFAKPKVTIGPISSSTRPDLPLMADLSLPLVTIERAEEDYFLRTQKPVVINDRKVNEKLLADGDRIALSARCRLKFSVPNAASTTATLHISGARLARPDISCIILADRDILVGADSNNHIRADHLKDKLTFLIQDGQIFCKTGNKIVVNDHHYDPKAPLPFNVTVKVGNLSLVITQLKR